MQKFNKATAGALSAALVGLLAALTDLSPEVLAAVGTLLTAVAVYLVPNKPSPKHGGGGGP